MSKLKDIPSNPEDLKAYYKKLKDKELRLEGDLAINDDPDLEDAIMGIILALHDVKEIDSKIRVVERPSADVESRIVALKGQVALYESRLEAVKATLKELESGGGKFHRMSGDYVTALKNLRDQVLKWKDRFEAQGVNLLELIPTLSEFAAKFDSLPEETA